MSIAVGGHSFLNKNEWMESSLSFVRKKKTEMSLCSSGKSKNIRKCWKKTAFDTLSYQILNVVFFIAKNNFKQSPQIFYRIH